MTRSRAIEQSEFPYTIGGRCINREWFNLPMPLVWQIMSEQLYYLHVAFEVEILSFVLMSNHYHGLIRTPRANISNAMRSFMMETSRGITKADQRINQTYGQRHHRTIVSSHHYYLHAYKYFYRNPVAAGLCERVEDYPYSTLHGKLGRSHLLIPVAEDTTLFSDVEGTLAWLNRSPEESAWQSVRQALRHSTFTLRKDPNTKRPNQLEFDML